MNEAIQNLLNRRSVRQYEARQVPDELLDTVLQAGIYAASGMNTQGVRLVAVRDKETRDLLSKLNAAVMGADRDPFYGAPCVIVVLGDPEIYPVVENFLVYIRQSKFQLCGEYAGMSGGYICLRQGAIHPDGLFPGPAQLQLLAL